MAASGNTVLWWGHFDPDYSRNRILREIFARAGWTVSDFHPVLSRLGDLQASFGQIPTPDLLWVPCFRQRDLTAAVRWARRKNIPVVFDPLISAYDKQVFERQKFPVDGSKAKRLLYWERQVFAKADLVIADTEEHRRFFAETLQVDKQKVAVVPVGAEESLFFPTDASVEPTDPLTVLFYGSFLNLQGPDTIVQAARLYQGPPATWKLIGDGPLLEQCRDLAVGLPHLTFEPWLAYTQLPDAIRAADILLGVFGTTAKADRVIPNKVYQALACGKPLITRDASAYPDSLGNVEECGIVWVAPGDPQQLAAAVTRLATAREKLPAIGQKARQSYESHFSMASISAKLMSALQTLLS